VGLSVFQISTIELVDLSEVQVDSLMRNRGLEQTGVNKFVVSQLYKIAKGGFWSFVHSLIKNISYMMFALMPGFALLLFISYKKQSRYYIESLILSVHFHCFAFFLMSFLFLIGLHKTIFFILITLLILPVYLFLSLWKYYNHKIIVTSLKTVGIGVLYILLFLIMIVSTIVISIVLV
jgi:hypothetical protein